MRHRPLVPAGVLVIAVAAGAPAAPARPLPDPVETSCTVGLPGDRSLVGLVPGETPDTLRRSGFRVTGSIPELGIAVVAGRLRTPPPGAAWVEPDLPVRALETPADPLLDQQWGLRDVHATTAWNVEIGTSSPVTVAVLDTGVDLIHPDLAGKVVDGPNTLGGTTSQDDNVHGTHVAGIAAAATNNRRGVAGMSWGATVLAVKVLGANGSGSMCAVVQGIVRAVQAGARVLNLSLGATAACPAAFQRAADFAAANDAVVVAAAGNDGGGFNHPSAPADCDGVLGVGATGPDDRIAAFSNYGWYVDVSAPGVAIVSTVLDPATNKRGYGELSGTSMATPFVAGLAALLASAHPDWTAQQISDRIVATARDRGARGPDAHFGAGVIDAAKALR